MIVRKAELSIAKRLAAVAGEDAQLEAKFLLQANGFHSPYQELSETDARALDPLIERRLAGEPLAYILGEWEFYGLPFYVDRTVLIQYPQIETETYTSISTGEKVFLPATMSHTILTDILRGDLGFEGVIVSDALDMTERNARRNGVSLELIRSDFLDAIDGEFDLIVCNPPYLTRADMDGRDASLRYEPELALYGGEDGLAFYRRLANEYTRVLKKGGTLLLEIGMTQREAVEALFSNAECMLDYGGRARVITVKRND